MVFTSYTLERTEEIPIGKIDFYRGVDIFKTSFKTSNV